MTDRVGDRKLWSPDHPVPRFANPGENVRVRALLVKALQVAVDADDRDMPSEKKWAQARTEFARDWVALAEKVGFRKPGEQLRTPLAGEDPLARQAGTAHTELRQFLEGDLKPEWELTGIESVCADRLGLALPGKAYEVQGKLL